MTIILTQKQESYVVHERTGGVVYEESTPADILRQLKEIDSEYIGVMKHHLFTFRKEKAPADAEFSVKKHIA